MEASERFRNHKNDIDILVTDIVMPGYSGDQLAVKLAAEKPNLPVLFISGNAPNQVESVVPLREGENFLRKPFSLDTLERAIAMLLGSDQQVAVE